MATTTRAGKGSELTWNEVDANFNAAEAVRVDTDVYGFLNQTETTIAFDHASNTFTLGSVGASWSYYRTGVKYTITGSKTASVSAATATTTGYFVFIDATDGTLSVSTSPWTLYDTKVPVAIVVRNSGMTPNYLLCEERHSCRILRRTHMWAHYTTGTLYSSGAALTGPTVASSTNSAKTCAVTAAYIFDEDIYQATAAITAGNGSSDTFYSVAYRTATGAWAWQRSLVPFKYTGAGAIEYDLSGTMTAAGAGGGGSTRYVNYYLALTNVSGQESVMWIPGRAVFTTAALAYAEDFGTFDMAGFLAPELVAIYQFTWDTNGSGLGLCRLVRTPVRISKNVVSSTTSNAATHNGLAGLQGGALDDYQHLTTAQLAVVDATSGTNTGDNSANSTYANDYRAANFVAGTNYVAPTGSDGTVTRQMFKDTGFVFYDSSTTNGLDYVNGSCQRWAPNTGAQTLTISNWPPTGNLGELLIQGINLGAATITWPTINWVKSDGTTTTTFSSNGVTLQSSGTDWVYLWTRDAGTTIYGKVVR